MFDGETTEQSAQAVITELPAGTKLFFDTAANAEAALATLRASAGPDVSYVPAWCNPPRSWDRTYTVRGSS